MAKSLVLVTESFTPSGEAQSTSHAQSVRRVLVQNIRRSTLTALTALNAKDVFSAEEMAECALVFDELAKCTRSMATNAAPPAPLARCKGCGARDELSSVGLCKYCFG